jgi:hypothetical protein
VRDAAGGRTLRLLPRVSVTPKLLADFCRAHVPLPFFRFCLRVLASFQVRGNAVCAFTFFRFCLRVLASFQVRSNAVCAFTFFRFCLRVLASFQVRGNAVCPPAVIARQLSRSRRAVSGLPEYGLAPAVARSPTEG